MGSAKMLSDIGWWLLARA